MEINFAVNYESEIWGYQTILHRYMQIKRIEDLEVRRCSGLYLALNAAVITVAMRIAKLLEDLFKGVVNLNFSYFNPEYRVSDGVAQLKSFPVSVIKVVILPAEVVVSFCITTCAVYFACEDYTQWCQRSYDVEVDRLMEYPNQISVPGYLIKTLELISRFFSSPKKEAAKPKEKTPDSEPEPQPKPKNDLFEGAIKNLLDEFNQEANSESTTGDKSAPPKSARKNLSSALNNSY